MNRIKYILFGILLPVINFYAQAQDKYYISSAYNGSKLSVIINAFEEKYQRVIYYDPEIINDQNITIYGDSISLRGVILQATSSDMIFISSYLSDKLFISSEKAIKTTLPPHIFRARSEKDTTITYQSGTADDFLKSRSEYLTKKIIIGNRNKFNPDKILTLTGIVKDAKSGEPVIGGTIYIEELEKGTATNKSGFYILKLPGGKYTLQLGSVDKHEEKVEIEIYEDGAHNFDLYPRLVSLDEVVVTADKFHNVRGTQMGVEKVEAKTLKKIPTVLGESDISKVALLLPGVQTVGEGASGFNVRGGQSDQNLFILNNLPIYNTSHMFGFFSSFHPDAINEFTLYKSSIPSHYGGRLASVFDISAKQGNMKKFSTRGGISPVTGRLLIEGPIAKDKLSYMAGFRTTYSNWILRFIEDPEIRNSNIWFGDAISNIVWNINESNKISFLTYVSKDRLSLTTNIKHQYGNLGNTLSWNKIINGKHELSVSLLNSRYSFEEINKEIENQSYNHSYHLRHDQANIDISIYPGEKHHIIAGLTSTLYSLNRGTHKPHDELSVIERVDMGEEKGLESAFYLSDEWQITPRLTMNAGIRYNVYNYLGPNTVYDYLEGAPRVPENITDTTQYGSNDVIKTYQNPEFRISGKYLLTPNLSVKLSYNQIHQYIFILSNTTSVAPTDKWKLADYHIEPLSGQQISAGIYTNIFNNRYELSLEGYRKLVKNYVDYKDGANLLVNTIPETDVLQGDQNIYGIEFMVKKNYGKLNGWMNYTYSRSLVQISNAVGGESINQGYTYPSNYDKPHSLNLVSNYQFTRRYGFSFNLAYSTGRPITYPTAVYYNNGLKTLNYSLRNEFRIPDYFRIDLSLNIEGNLKSKKAAHGSWMISVYNVTGRKNAYSVYFKTEDGQIQGYKMSIFGVPVFTVTYNFKFGNYAN